jgi:hypothetical protein
MTLPKIPDRVANLVNVNQQRSWAYIAYKSTVDPLLIGQKRKYNVSRAIFRSPPSSSFSPANSTTGLLGTMSTKFFVDFVKDENATWAISNVTPVPYFQYVDSNSPDALDDAISSSITAALDKISSLDKSSFFTLSFKKAVILQAEIAKELANVPSGGIYFKEINHQTGKYAWDYHFGNDKRLLGSSTFSLAGPRLLFQQSQLSNAILRSSNSSLNGAQITHGFRLMPFYGNTKLTIPFGGIIGSILYPFGVSFLLPIFTVGLVREKETRIFTMMKMNGMGTLPYHISHYLTMYILYAISTLIFLTAGFFSKLTFFTQTQPAVLLLLFFVWGHNQISLAFFFTSIFNKSRNALGNRN